MTIKHRRYKLLSDFERVYKFLKDNYNSDHFNGYLLPSFYEYAHTHPAFNHKLTHRFGLWEENSDIVGIACYEVRLGECILVVKAGYEDLYPEMLTYGEKELSEEKDGRHTLTVYSTDKQGLDDLLTEGGYEVCDTETITIYPYEKGFKELPLPEGFSIISLEDENDLKKIHACLWKGFNHGPNPDDDIDGRLFMQSAPRFNKELTTVIKAPNGDYACFAGMWEDTQNQYAYLEPLATVPEYRRMGLATIALMEGMKKSQKYGAKYCFGGQREFYGIIGFENVGKRIMWKKTWG